MYINFLFKLIFKILYELVTYKFIAGLNILLTYTLNFNLKIVKILDVPII